MLVEIKDVSQDDEPGYRRWFIDNYFDLIIWYDDDDTITGFQLCYDKAEAERSLTWIKDRGFSHNNTIAERFKKESKKIDAELSSFVYSKLLMYPRK